MMAPVERAFEETKGYALSATTFSTGRSTSGSQRLPLRRSSALVTIASFFIDAMLSPASGDTASDTAETMPVFGTRPR